MKPAMKQTITVNVPYKNEKGQQSYDKYGRPITVKETVSHKPLTFPCHTRERGELYRDLQFRMEDARDEVDVMPDVPVNEGMEVSYTTISGKTKKGIIQAITETPNLTGSKIYFRTCVINETSTN